ncbi:TonB-dependent siderophore receptor [Methylobacterium sp. WSM2598]|uniref:TonB-dependent siderophore receptor n=1 Tax=Methylobacterium sp. WSM2598 TaxID=398261 RepID=UPI0003617117|nr:TonB-dependent receptor [Methylobacterium sp. WSM2598]
MTMAQRMTAGSEADRSRGPGPVRGGRSRRWRLVALLLSTASAASVLPPLVLPASAQDLVDFAIPAGDLGGVLAQIGRAGGRTIAFPADVTQGRAAGPIIGRMTVRDAVDRALAGSGLVATPSAQGSLTIRRGQGSSAVVPSRDGMIAAIDVADLAGSTGDRGFLSGSTVTSDRLNFPQKENPRSVVGVTREVIKAQASTSILEAATNASNVTVNYGAGQGSGIPSYTIRGFSVQNVMVGGRVGPRGMNLPVQDVERVDVIKGPTTDLTGVSLEGGGINIIPKAPSADPIREAQFTLGSRFYRTLAFDLGGPVEGAEGLTYRLNLSGNTADTSFGGDRSPHEGLISPKIRWDDGATIVTAGVRYFDQLSGLPPMTIGIPSLHFRPLRVDREKPIGTPEAGASFRAFNPYVDVEHRFDAIDTANFGSFDFTFRNRTGYFANNYVSSGYIFVPSRSAAAVPLGGGFTSATERQFVTQSDLIAVHTFQDYKQTARFGIDYTNDYLVNYNLVEYPAGLIDPRNPPLTLPLPNRQGSLGRNFKTRVHLGSEDIGLAFQDKIDLFDRLHILGSVMQDFYSSDRHTEDNGKSSHSLTDYGALTYSAGGVYDITKWMSIYGTIGTGFIPNRGVLADGKTPAPQYNDSNEYGLKFNLLNDSFMITASHFEISYSNTLIYRPDLRASVLGPGTTSKGFELDFQGQVTENLSLIGSVGRTIIQYPRRQPGDVYPGIPSYTGKLYAVYSFTDGPLKGLQIGGGAEGIPSTYTSFGSKNDNYKLPGHVTLDAMLSYTKDNMTISLNVKNLLNQYYYQPTQTPMFVPIGEGRRILAQARVTF